MRPWIESGLEFVLRTAVVGEAALSNSSSQHAVTTEPEADHPVSQQASSSVRQPAAQYPAHGTSSQPISPSQHSTHGSVQQPVQPPVQRPMQTRVQQPAQRPVAPVFPPPWNGFMRFARSAAPKVLMTYMELGLDFGGQPDHRRSSVLKNIQAHLKWPQGTMNFWPVAALKDGTLQPSTQMFWQGWEQWRAPNIVCFGEEALKIVLPDADPNVTTHMLEYVTVHKMAPLSHLVTLLPHEQQISVEELFKIRL
ncbi:hypothetical protein GO013_11140 [Pseudodesulfovibrio sp. JC047]|nr:hypothetical protein [Pseudodesulfovibrio sp. JC047]